MTITQALRFAYLEIASHDAPHLEAEIILAHVLQVSRTYLYSNPGIELTDRASAQFLKLVARAKLGEPIAYLTNQKEFWSQPLYVTHDTLIPRDDTETLIEIILQTFPDKAQMHLADLGTGSGAIAIAIAKEKPHWQIYATDKSTKALAVARTNAERLQLSNITFCEGDWCDALPSQQFNIIVSNPPYLDKNDNEIAETVLKYEPVEALIAADNGFADLKKIAMQAQDYLTEDGLLLMEHGYQQAAQLKKILLQYKYQGVVSYKDLNGQTRATSAKKL